MWMRGGSSGRRYLSAFPMRFWKSWRSLFLIGLDGGEGIVGDAGPGLADGPVKVHENPLDDGAEGDWFAMELLGAAELGVLEQRGEEAAHTGGGVA